MKRPQNLPPLSINAFFSSPMMQLPNWISDGFEVLFNPTSYNSNKIEDYMVTRLIHELLLVEFNLHTIIAAYKEINTRSQRSPRLLLRFFPIRHYNINEQLPSIKDKKAIKKLKKFIETKNFNHFCVSGDI